MAYVPWTKPGSSINTKLAEFGCSAGSEALECVTTLFARHSPWHPKKILSEPVAVTWEDSWSSKELGTRENGYIGTRDREGSSILDLLGSKLRAQGMKFTDPTFPAKLSPSLCILPRRRSMLAWLRAHAWTHRPSLPGKTRQESNGAGSRISFPVKQSRLARPCRLPNIARVKVITWC